MEGEEVQGFGFVEFAVVFVVSFPFIATLGLWPNLKGDEFDD